VLVRSSFVAQYSNSKATIRKPVPAAKPPFVREDGVGVTPRNPVRSARAGAATSSTSTHMNPKTFRPPTPDLRPPTSTLLLCRPGVRRHVRLQLQVEHRLAADEARSVFRPEVLSFVGERFFENLGHRVVDVFHRRIDDPNVDDVAAGSCFEALEDAPAER